MLEAMGVEHGCEVEICKVGSPCILRIESTRFGVGREVASRITATVTDTLDGSALPG
jgi:Fe2+ transport system protein FeoA